MAAGCISRLLHEARERQFPMPNDDLEYYRRRLAEEQARAFQATSLAAKAAHRRLAIAYWEKVELLEIGGGAPPDEAANQSLREPPPAASPAG